MGFCFSPWAVRKEASMINPSKLWKGKLKKREILGMIKTVIKEAPWAGTICMSLNNAKRLGMPEKLYGRKVIIKDFPDSFFIVGGE